MKFQLIWRLPRGKALQINTLPMNVEHSFFSFLYQLYYSTYTVTMHRSRGLYAMDLSRSCEPSQNIGKDHFKDQNFGTVDSFSEHMHMRSN